MWKCNCDVAHLCLEFRVLRLGSRVNLELGTRNSKLRERRLSALTTRVASALACSVGTFMPISPIGNIMCETAPHMNITSPPMMPAIRIRIALSSPRGRSAAVEDVVAEGAPAFRAPPCHLPPSLLHQAGVLSHDSLPFPIARPWRATPRQSYPLPSSAIPMPERVRGGQMISFNNKEFPK